MGMSAALLKTSEVRSQQPGFRSQNERPGTPIAAKMESQFGIER
jgi:hypothetical protein